MSKSKKPRKKKYIPIPVRYPSLVTQINSFQPFEAALTKLLETGEAECDENGMLIFRDSASNIQSFVTSIKVYIDIITIYCSQNKIQYDLYPLHLLQNRMFEARGFCEEEIEEAQKCLAVCKQIIVKIKPSILLDMLNTVRIASGIERNINPSLKTPEMLLYVLKHQAGDLPYEIVCQRNKQYQQLAKEHPEDPHILKLRDFYVEYFTAYNFFKQQQIA